MICLFSFLMHSGRTMILFTLLLLLSPVSMQASQIHSYERADGIRVLTNLVQSQIHHSTLPPLLQKRAQLYQPLVWEISNRYGVDGDLVNAIIHVESNYLPKAISPKGCQGLMQLHPDTSRRFGVYNPLDPIQNIEGGVRYLDFLLDYFQSDLELVLAAYNSGENTVKRYGGVPPYPETVNYVSKVQQLYTTAQARPPTDKIFRVLQPNGEILLTNTPKSPIF